MLRQSASFLLLALVLVASVLQVGCRTRRHADLEPTLQEGVVHVAAAGDTLSKISNLYHVSIDDIIDANRLQYITLVAGQKLFIPGARPVSPPPPQAALKPAVPPPAYGKPRANWSNTAIDYSNIDPMGPTIWRMTIHHSGDAIDLNDNSVQTLRRIEQQHMLGMGKNVPFACIGYHLIISGDGSIWEGRPLKYQGAHATGDNNKGNVGICLLGNFDRQHPTPAQRGALDRLVERLSRDFRISRSNIVGHNHFKSTDCPGKNLEPIVEAYSRGQ
jgi:LysM repeat protein